MRRWPSGRGDPDADAYPDACVAALAGQHPGHGDRRVVGVRRRAAARCLRVLGREHRELGLAGLELEQWNSGTGSPVIQRADCLVLAQGKTTPDDRTKTGKTIKISSPGDHWHF